MGIKSHIGSATIGLFFFLNTAMAGQMYSVDSSQSYIQAYTPSWVQNPWSGYTSLTPEGELEFVSTPVWDLVWNQTTIALSGSFDGVTQMSPWAPGVGRLVISQQTFNVSTPFPIAFNLPTFLTFYQPSGEISYDGGPCASDPFFGPVPPGWYCSGFTNGIPPSLSGTFDGNTLDIQGVSGGLVPLLITQYSGEDPPVIDASFYPQNYSAYSYRIVANSVPEPDTLPLALLGIALLMISRCRSSREA